MSMLSATDPMQLPHTAAAARSRAAAATPRLLNAVLHDTDAARTGSRAARNPRPPGRSASSYRDASAARAADACIDVAYRPASSIPVSAETGLTPTRSPFR